MANTFGYYKAFLPDLLEDMEHLLSTIRRHPLPSLYGLHLNNVKIRAPTPREGEGQLVAMIEVDLSFMFTDTYHYEDYIFLYGINTRGFCETCPSFKGFERHYVNYYHYLFGNPCRDWLFRIPCLPWHIARQRTRQFKEELVAAVWRPDRVAKRLEEGGWDAIDAFA